MFKERYLGANDYVEMNDGIDRSMLATLGRRRRRRLLTAVSLVLALLVLAPWAASNPAVYQWLSRVAPPVAHFLLPSGGSEEENGIRVQVTEVTREDDTLLIRLTLEDLEGDRLSGTTSPEHWYCEQGRGSAYGSCVPYYDAQTGLLHLNLRCEPERNIAEFDWERWVTIRIENLRTRTEHIEGSWRIQVSPITEE